MPIRSFNHCWPQALRKKDSEHCSAMVRLSRNPADLSFPPVEQASPEGLLAIGGLLLVWIAYRLLTEEKEHGDAAATSMRAAIQTIIVADTVMGLDNVLAVAGASHGSFALVVIGLLISIPIVVW